MTFTENFNSTNSSFTRSPQSAWMIDTTLSVSGKAAWGFVPNAEGDSIELISPVYDLSNYAYAYLRFAHICKVSEEDLVTVEYKENYVGSKWTPIPFTDYKGESSVYRKQRCFHQGAYPEWVKNDMTAQPDNSWWKVESFDISQDVAYAEVQFKFKIKKGSTVGTNFAWGWFIDNFELMASTAQINPPVVQYIAPYTKGTVYSPGPYTIYVKAAKRTMVPLKTPILRVSYTSLGGSVIRDSMLMTAHDGDSIWKAVIPAQNVGTNVSYTVYAYDTVGNNNMATSGYTVGRMWGLDSNSVALISIDDPYVGALAGQQNPVVVTIENRGLATLTSAIINWSVNGVAQTPYKWTGSLNEGYRGKANLGNYLPTAGQYDTIVAMISAPNGASNTTVDTIVMKAVYGCASIPSGTFTINRMGLGLPGQQVYKSINEVLDMIRTCGTSGNVVISIPKGSYDEDIDLENFMNVMDPNSTLTIQSSTGKPEDVFIMGTSPASTKIRMNKSANIIIRDLTLQGTGSGIVMTDTNANIEIRNCHIYMDTVTSNKAYSCISITQGCPDRVKILNNVLKGAFYGVNTEGLSSTQRMTNITFSDNHISETEYGNLLYYTDFDYIKNNTIYSRSKNAVELFGIDMTYCNAEEVSGNHIITKSPVTSGQGIYASYFNIDSTRSGLIANNEIIMEGKADGIYTGNSEVRYFHNTVIVYGDNTTSSRAVYCLSATAGMSIHFYNNIFVNLGGGYPMYLTSSALIGSDVILDYNNCYGKQYVGYLTSAHTNINSWITATQDQHAASVEPAFLDYKNDARCVHYIGLTCPVVPEVPADILGKVRKGSTAMGCYTPNPTQFDAALLSYEDWKSSVTVGQATPVKVRLMNTGSKTNITLVEVHWSVNGIAQNTAKWTGNLAPYQDTIISIGNYLPNNGVNNVVAWIENQNGLSAGDSISGNDTILNTSFGCKAAMSGTYRVGLSKSADFPDMKQALGMLVSCGASGPVVFALESGKYEGFTFSGYYTGVSAKNTVTVTSLSGKAGDVVFTGSGAVVSIESPYFRLESVTVDGYSNNATVGVQITNTISNVQVNHCIINMDPHGTATTYGIHCVNGYKRDSIWLVGNRIDGGYYGIRFYNGIGSTNTDHGVYNRVDSNTITNPYYYGVYAYYTDIISYSFNKVSARAKDGYTYFYGLYSYYGNVSRMEGNHVDGYRDWLAYSYGIYVYYSNYTYSNNTSDTTLYINNEVRIWGKNTAYGMYVPYSREKLVNNSVYVRTEGTSAYGIYAYNSSSGYRSDLINNNVVLIGYPAGYAIYTYTSPTYAQLSGNNYVHENGTNLAYIGGARANLAAVQNYDKTATNVMPEFIDISLGLFIRKSINSGIDCPVHSLAMNDINGEKRPNPTIRGCYNPTVLTYNASLKNFTNPTVIMAMTGTELPVSVTLLNRGDSTITSADVYWEVNGVSQTAYKWSGTLTSDKTVVLNLGSFKVANESNIIKAYVHLNDSKDVLPLDDTVSTSVFGCSTGALSGTYKVGNGGGSKVDFTSLDDALTAVSKCGVSGPVVLQLEKGTYKEVVVSGAFPGGSSTNTVTITSMSGNKNDVIIKEYNIQDAVVLTNSANLNFRHVTIGDTASTQNGVVIAGTSDNVHFYDCNIYSVLGATSSSYNAVKRDASSTMLVKDLSFVKCNVRGGYYNFYMINAGTSSSAYGNMTIDSCNLLDAYYAGYFGTYPVNNVLTARHNYIHNATNSGTYYGFRFGNMSSSQNIDSLKGNRIWCNGSGTNYGVYVGQTVNYYAINYQLARIWNNEIVVERGTTNYGFYYGNMSYMDWRHNTFYIDGNATHYGIYNTNTGSYTFECYDNLFYVAGTQGTAACHEHSGGTGNLSAAWMSMDYNVYYNEVNGIIGCGITDINTWSAAIGKDKNALYERVYFRDVIGYNFHTNGARGIIPVDPTVTIDMNGKPRISYTNAGCYNDFIPSNYDASVMEITAPKNGETTGQTADCKVKIRNMGKLALASVTIQWKVNGTLQTPYKWQAPTAADTITYGGISPEIKIGSFTVPTGKYEVVVWTEDPNGYADLNKANDTAVIEVVACASPLAGTYTVGGTNGDFDTPEEAVTALLSCGVKSPVVLKIAAGNYDAFSIMGKIPGSSETNTVTFISATGNRDAVVIGNGASTALKLSGVSHLIFKDITIGATGSANNVAVEFANYNEDVLFHHCNLYASITTTNSSSRVVNYNNSTSSTNYLKDVRFIGNDVRGGYYGFYLYYAGGNAANCKSTAANRASVRLDSNYIHDVYYYSVYSYYYTNLESFSYNTIIPRSNSGYHYGAYLYYNFGQKIIGNHFHMINTSYAYPLYVYYMNNTSYGSDEDICLIANNEVICDKGTYGYGMYLYYPRVSVVNNSFYMYQSNTNYGLYLGTSGQSYEVNFLNNVIVCDRGSTNYVIYCTDAATLTTYPTLIDYNAYYSKSANMFYCGSARNFATWKSTYNMDAHSVNVKPDFNDPTVDLSIRNFSDQLKCNRQRTVLYDINGDARTSLTIMGAYSTPLFEGYDLQLEAFAEPTVGGIQCVPNSTPVKLAIYNMGTYDADFSANPVVLYLKCESDSVNFVKNITINKGGIGIMKRDTFEVEANLDITYPGLYKLTAWLVWNKDQQIGDDTLKLDYYVDKTVLPYDNNFTGTFAGVATNQAYGDITWEVVTSNPVLNPVFGTGSLLFRSS
ncbi:MAG: hypothetical protein J6S82_09995, partial [Bacteroidales bacterium]|nr:hypothetical protein [Bacteroidales bacterium]